MEKIFVLAILLMVAVSACGSPAPAPTITPQPTATATKVPTATEASTATPTIEPPTATMKPTSTIVATDFIAPGQQWRGAFKSMLYRDQYMSLLIDEMDGSSFIGKIVWTGGGVKNYMTNAVGEIVTDFSKDENRLKHHPDYKSGDRSGGWLKWTQTKAMTTNTRLGIWYYAHVVGEKMTVIIFANDTDPLPYANTILNLNLVK
jgi:hypothetical protein